MEGEQRIDLPNSIGTAIVTRIGNWQIKTELVPEYSQIEHDQKNMLEPVELTAFLDAGSLRNGVWGRTRQPGDRFQPLGMYCEKKLQDFFTDSKVPRNWRDRVPLLVSGERIAWVVGHRIAEWAKVEAGKAGETAVLRIAFCQKSQFAEGH